MERRKADKARKEALKEARTEALREAKRKKEKLLKTSRGTKAKKEEMVTKMEERIERRRILTEAKKARILLAREARQEAAAEEATVRKAEMSRRIGMLRFGTEPSGGLPAILKQGQDSPEKVVKKAKINMRRIMLKDVKTARKTLAREGKKKAGEKRKEKNKMVTAVVQRRIAILALGTEPKEDLPVLLKEWEISLEEMVKQAKKTVRKQKAMERKKKQKEKQKALMTEQRENALREAAAKAEIKEVFELLGPGTEQSGELPVTSEPTTAPEGKA